MYDFPNGRIRLTKPVRGVIICGNMNVKMESMQLIPFLSYYG